MAALQMTVSGATQNVSNLIVNATVMSSPTFLQGATFFGNNVTNLLVSPDTVTSPQFLQIDGGKFFERNTTRLVVIEGFGSTSSPSSGGGGASEPVSKESWE
jgi:hypothetical protein